VFRKKVHDVDAGDFVPFLWAFIHADARSVVPEELAGFHTNLYIMFTTSPKRDRWKPLTKYTQCVVIIMNPWFLEEIRLA
jgi:hypothetical protein